MNSDISFRGVFDRTCRRVLQMVMATDLPPKGSLNSNEFKSGAISENIKGAPNPSTRSERQFKRALRSKSTSCVANSVPRNDFQDRRTLEDEKDSSTRQSEPLATPDTSNHKPEAHSQVTHLRQLLLLHLELIQQQQEQLQKKEKELNQLKIDKEQLESRMHRMERRMAVKKRRGEFSGSEMETVEERVKPIAPKSRRVSAEQMVRSKRIPATSSVVMTSQMSEDVSYDTHIRTELLYLHQESLPLEKSGPLVKLEKATETTETKNVVVPSWQINELAPLSSKGGRSRTSSVTSNDEPVENLDDEAFIKRHIKQEVEEKRRKRWDVQRYRALQLHRTLEEKNKMREEARLKGRKSLSKDSESELEFSSQSFLPASEDILALEVSDTVPVSVFGCPVPLFHTKEFEVPWFSLERRELQERATRGRAKWGRGRGRHKHV